MIPINPNADEVEVREVSSLDTFYELTFVSYVLGFASPEEPLGRS